MDSRSIDQVIQSSRLSAEYTRRKHSRSSPASPQLKSTNLNSPIIRKTSLPISSFHPFHPSTSRTSSPKSVTLIKESSIHPKNTMTTGAFTDFFSDEVFQMVLHNPTTSHRFMNYCRKRACGQHMEFLAEIDNYHRVLEDLTKTIATIQRTYIGSNAEKEIDITGQETRAIQNSIKHSVRNVIPSLECIFLDAQERVETTLKDIYPRFVHHQITTSASLALGSSGHSGTYQGLGDCFCLTDPSQEDNPIIFSSDGFVDVTGYSRKEILNFRNCRFLQGPATDRFATSRIGAALAKQEETVELLLNYRKNGEPFWNLLYVCPLYDNNNKLAFFLGGQINCSTTVHNYTDVLRILSLPDDEDCDELSISDRRTSSIGSNGLQKVPSGTSTVVPKSRSSFFKSWWGDGTGGRELREKLKVRILETPGMEPTLTDKFRKMDMALETQVEAFYTTYSKYLVLRIKPDSYEMLITFYSPSMLEFLLFPQLAHQAQKSSPFSNQGPSSLSLFARDIFKVLADPPLSANLSKGFKATVRESVRKGKAVSIEMGLMTGTEEVTKGGKSGSKRVEEKYISHWTVLKDGEGNGQWVVLTFAPE